jgi:hypothetical protein
MSTPTIFLIGVVVVVSGYFVVRRLESMSGKSTEELKAILNSSNWTYYRNALVELHRRGEDINELVVPILNLLISESKSQRIGGWMILRQLYPDLASRVSDFKPQETPEICKDKLQKIILQAN